MRRVALGTAAAGVLALGLVWSQRQPIAANVIDRMLAARGVQARYKVAAIGFRDQRLENVSIGDPNNPDLTADSVLVRLAVGVGGVSLKAVEASGVRLRGAVRDGALHWGEVDKLLPAPSGKPLTLPDIDLTVRDSLVILATPVGAVNARIDGKGKLADGFRGRALVTAPAIGPEDCRIADLKADIAIAIDRRAPHITGPASAARADCGGVTVAGAGANLDVKLVEALDRWNGSARLRAEGIERGAMRLAKLSGQARFAGTASDTGGRASLLAQAGRMPSAGAQGIAVDADYRLSGPATTANGTLRIDRLIPDRALLAQAQGGLKATASTPVGPIGDALARAITGAGEGARVESSFAAKRDRQGFSLAIDQVSARSRSGAALRLAGGQGITVGAQGFAADTRVTLGGGGFPAVSGDLNYRADGTTRGLLTMQPYAAGNARLALAPLRFAARADGTARIETEVTLDGPMPGGRIAGLNAPVVIQRRRDGAILINPACTPIRVGALSMASLALDPARLSLCPAGAALAQIDRRGVLAGGRFGPVALKGRIGSSPMSLAARSGSVSTRDLALVGAAIRIGNAGRQTQLDIGKLDGRFASGGITGGFEALAGEIGRVPLLVREGKGTWRFASGALDVAGAMMVSDADPNPRFNPLASDDAKLRLVDNRITATATLREPESRTAVAKVDIVHALGDGAGEAKIAVDQLTFSKSFQPGKLTRLTKGVVENVVGTIDGTGSIRWNARGVTSDGTFRTDRIDLAAAFGPVERLSGTIRFDDLLALSTPPGQQVKIGLVNPGVEVKDGVITFRLRPEQQIDIAGGRWPFAGGDLLLEPTTLDMRAKASRKLIFRIAGLDAAKFIEQLKLQDIAVTGTFDGALPIAFDDQGSRIEGGRVVVREGGGTLAYVGDVSNAKMNMFAKMAFDALKSMRYKRLSIDLDGALDGELVSKVTFNGVNQAPVGAAAGGLTKSFTNLPFLFNITIRAPFRGLMSTARGLQDPSSLLKPLQRPVQPPSSETKP